MRLLFLVLFVLLGLINTRCGWVRAAGSRSGICNARWRRRKRPTKARARNAALEAEVRDLDGGTGAVEERARGELGMMREGEVFVHILPQNATPPAGGASLATEAVAKPAATPARAGSGAPARPAAGAAASQGRPAASQSGSGARH